MSVELGLHGLKAELTPDGLILTDGKTVIRLDHEQIKTLIEWLQKQRQQVEQQSCNYRVIVESHQTPLVHHFPNLASAKHFIDDEIQFDFFPIGIYSIPDKTLYFNSHSRSSSKHLIETALEALELKRDDINAIVWY